MIEDGLSGDAVLNYTETESEMGSYGAFLRGDAVFLRNWPYVCTRSRAIPKSAGHKPGGTGGRRAEPGKRGATRATAPSVAKTSLSTPLRTSGRRFGSSSRWMTASEQSKTNAIEGRGCF